jgi:hypothetical protein
MKGLPNWMLGRGFRWKNSVTSLPAGVQGNRFPARLGRARFCDALLNHVDLLGTFPHIGVVSAQRPNVRSVLHTPVRIYYRIEDSRECVEIIHLWHTARRTPVI